MLLTLRRIWFTDQSTMGELSLDDKLECFTLELPDKDGKPGSCIPQGTYRVAIEPSPRFQREMPRLTGIPGREDILIHWGNYPKDTDGCILVGQSRPFEDFLGQSRLAFEELFPKIQQAQNKDEAVEIAIIGGARAVAAPEAIHLDAGDN